MLAGTDEMFRARIWFNKSWRYLKDLWGASRCSDMSFRSEGYISNHHRPLNHPPGPKDSASSRKRTRGVDGDARNWISQLINIPDSASSQLRSISRQVSWIRSGEFGGHGTQRSKIRLHGRRCPAQLIWETFLLWIERSAVSR
jgi:hypothetical protein